MTEPNTVARWEDGLAAGAARAGAALQQRGDHVEAVYLLLVGKDCTCAEVILAQGDDAQTHLFVHLALQLTKRIDHGNT